MEWEDNFFKPEDPKYKFIGYFKSRLVGRLVLEAMARKNFIDPLTIKWIGSEKLLASLLSSLNKKHVFIGDISREQMHVLSEEIFQLKMGSGIYPKSGSDKTHHEDLEDLIDLASIIE